MHTTNKAQIESVPLLSCIGRVMVSVFALNTVGRAFEPRSGETKYYQNG